MPTPRFTATSAPMPFAQKPSILRSSSALAAVTPKLTPAPSAPGTGAIVHAVALEIDAGFGEEPAQPHLDPGRGADALALDHFDITLRRAERRVHHQEPVHALRLRAEKLGTLPFRKRRQRRVRRAADEIHRAVAHRRVGLIDREDHLQLDVQPFLLEEAELDRGDRRKVGVGDHVGHGKLHGRQVRWLGSKSR